MKKLILHTAFLLISLGGFTQRYTLAPVLHQNSASVTTPSYVSTQTTYSGGTTSLDANYPSTISADNLLMAIIYINGNSQSITTPSGWTNYLTNSGGTVTSTVAVYYKIATGSESGTVTFTGWGSSQRTRVTMLNYDNVSTTTVFNSNDTGNNSNGTTTTGNSINTTDNSMLLFVTSGDNGGLTSVTGIPTGMTARVNVSEGDQIAVFDEEMTSGTSGSKVATHSQAMGTKWIMLNINGQ